MLRDAYLCSAQTCRAADGIRTRSMSLTAGTLILSYRSLASQPMSQHTNIAVLILTRNDSLHLARALRSIKSFAREIFIVESSSSCDTVEIAKMFGAQILEHPLHYDSEQLEWALDCSRITSDWIMYL